jgi:DNA-binding LacI/PurR family transcriptional regulator
LIARVSKRFETDGVLGRPTIRDVAKSAGVSLSTVSAVLNQSAPTSAPTRQRVLTAVRELGYEPNSQARNLRRRRAGAIGLIVPDIVNPFFALVAEGVQEEARSSDFLLVLCSSEARPDREADHARLLRTSRLDGVIHLSGTGLSDDAVVDLALESPLVIVDERLPGLDRPFVGSDNKHGARLAASFAIEHGHVRFAIVAGPPRLSTAADRLAGYLDALEAAGIDTSSVPTVAGDYRLQSGRVAAAQLLSGPAKQRPTVLLVANDLMAIGCMRYCAESGIAVPDELGIVGYDDIALAALVTPGLTTVRQPAREMGRAAARMLLDEIDERPRGADVDLPAELIVRQSLTEAP